MGKEIYDIDDVEQGIITQEEYERQDDCEDDVYHVECFHCDTLTDPNEDPIYCWDIGIAQIFVCEGCDAEHRTNLKTKLQVQQWRKDYDNG